MRLFKKDEWSGSLENRCPGPARSTGKVVIEHPTGQIAIDRVVAGSGAGLHVARAFVIRTARLISAGSVMIPGRILARVSKAAIGEAA